jgi:ferrous iron transport protein A
MGKTLADLTVGATGLVAGFSREQGECRSKLLSMGLVSNTPFEVIRVAPMGDPVEIRVRDYKLSLRKDEARALMVREGEGR